MQFMFSKFAPHANGTQPVRPGRGPERPTRLIVIGHARSGTTILLRALNTSPDVHMLGEPNSYLDDGEDNFRARFNRMHSNYSNQICKATYAPALPNLPEDADLPVYFETLAEHHRIYGEKVALASPRFGYDTGKLRNWIETNRPSCLFVFRHPQSMIASMERKFPHISWEENIFTYAATVCLYLDLARVLPDIRHVIHESISAKTFKRLGQWLKTDLSSAGACYLRRPAISQPPSPRPEMDPLIAAYAFLAKSKSDLGVISPALAQTAATLSDAKQSEVGQIYLSLYKLMNQLRQFTVPV